MTSIGKVFKQIEIHSHQEVEGVNKPQTSHLNDFPSRKLFTT